jgi:hypothetical protein
MNPYTLIFRIDGLPKRTNNMGGNWRAKHSQSKLWKARVQKELLIRHLPEKPLDLVKLTLVRHSSMKPDFDGLVSSFKHVIDGLIEGLVLADDQMENFLDGQPKYIWEYAPPCKGFIEVSLHEVIL